VNNISEINFNDPRSIKDFIRSWMETSTTDELVKRTGLGKGKLSTIGMKMRKFGVNLPRRRQPMFNLTPEEVSELNEYIKGMELKSARHKLEYKK